MENLTRRHFGRLAVAVATAAATGASMADEALQARERKARSLARLKKMGVSVNESLPAWPQASSQIAKSTREVATRVVLLRHVAGAASTYVDGKAIRVWMKKNQILDQLSPREKRKFFETQAQWQQDVDLSWRIESAWFLLWAVGMVAELSQPFEAVSAEQMRAEYDRIPLWVDNGDVTNFIAQARMRPTAAILDELDFTYRAHWATRNQEHVDPQTRIGKLNPGVVLERHYAGNWLMQPAMDWDEVKTPT